MIWKRKHLAMMPGLFWISFHLAIALLPQDRGMELGLSRDTVISKGDSITVTVTNHTHTLQYFMLSLSAKSDTGWKRLASDIHGLFSKDHWAPRRLMAGGQHSVVLSLREVLRLAPSSANRLRIVLVYSDNNFLPGKQYGREIREIALKLNRRERNW